MTNKKIVPNPGSDKAIGEGCICPVMDNMHGEGCGWGPNTFIYTKGCPLHSPIDKKIKKE